MSDAGVIDVATRTLKLEREFSAPRARVFDAFTNPAVLQQWWGPEGVNAEIEVMDVREGGAWRTIMRNAQGEAWTVSGTYVELSAPNRLAFTWGWEEDGVRGHETLVEIDLEEAGTGTRLKLLHSVFDTSDSRDRHEEGWCSSLVCLEAVV